MATTVTMTAPGEPKTVKEYKDALKTKGITGYSGMTKDQLRALYHGYGAPAKKPAGASGASAKEASPRSGSPTVAQLKAELKAKGIKGYSGRKKEELQAMLAGQPVAPRPTADGASKGKKSTKKGPVPFEEWTVNQLKAQLKARGIKGYSGKKKEDLIALLK